MGNYDTGNNKINSEVTFREVNPFLVVLHNNIVDLQFLINCVSSYAKYQLKNMHSNEIIYHKLQ